MMRYSGHDLAHSSMIRQHHEPRGVQESAHHRLRLKATPTERHARSTVERDVANLSCPASVAVSVTCAFMR
jgi:hypothetical protein